MPIQPKSSPYWKSEIIVNKFRNSFQFPSFLTAILRRNLLTESFSCSDLLSGTSADTVAHEYVYQSGEQTNAQNNQWIIHLIALKRKLPYLSFFRTISTLTPRRRFLFSQLPATFCRQKRIHLVFRYIFLICFICRQATIFPGRVIFGLQNGFQSFPENFTDFRKSIAKPYLLSYFVIYFQQIGHIFLHQPFLPEITLPVQPRCLDILPRQKARENINFFFYHLLCSVVPNKGLNLVAMDSRALKIRLRMVPIGQSITEAISS